MLYPDLGGFEYRLSNTSMRFSQPLRVACNSLYKTNSKPYITNFFRIYNNSILQNIDYQHLLVSAQDLQVFMYTSDINSQKDKLMSIQNQFPQTTPNQNDRTQTIGGYPMSPRNTHYDDDEFTLELRKKG